MGLTAASCRSGTQNDPADLAEALRALAIRAHQRIEDRPATAWTSRSESSCTI